MKTMVGIKEIEAYPNNARRITESAVEAVAQSIKRYGMRQPIVVDKNNVIVAGHVRHQACFLLGHEEVWIERADDLSEQEINEYRLVDNRMAEMTGWDIAKLTREIDTLVQNTSNVEDLDLVGFDDEEIYTLLGLSDDEAHNDKFDKVAEEARDSDIDNDKLVGSDYVLLQFSLPREHSRSLRPAIDDLVAKMIREG